MTPVEKLEERFLPLCANAKDQLVSIYPKYNFHIWSSSVGGATTLQGHNLGLEVRFPEADPEDANTVAIVIGLRHLTTEPEIDDVSVSWGVGVAPTEGTEIVEEPVFFNEANLKRIEKEFPTLLDAFEKAIAAYSDKESNLNGPPAA